MDTTRAAMPSPASRSRAAIASATSEPLAMRIRSGAVAASAST